MTGGGPDCFRVVASSGGRRDGGTSAVGTEGTETATTPEDVQALLAEDDAASPAIGAVPVVAITVVLAGLVGTFVTGVGGEAEKPPTATVDFEYEPWTVTVAHADGEPLPVSAVARETSSTNTLAKNTAPTEYTAGDGIESGTYDPGETIRVVWVNAEAEKSVPVGQSTAPA